MAELTEEKVNELLQKMGIKNESNKNTMTTLVDDEFNNFVTIIKMLWQDIATYKKEIEKLKADNNKPKAKAEPVEEKK